MIDASQQAEFKKPSRSSACGVSALASLFMKTYQGDDSEKVKQAEQLLQKMSGQQAFLDNLSSLMIDEEFSRKAQVRMAAAAYIRQYVGNVFQKKNQSLINKMVEKLMGLLHKHRIPIKMRAAVVGALQFATTKDTRNIIRQAYSQNLIKLLQTTLSKPFDIDQYMFCVLSGIVLLGIPRSDSLYNQLYEKTFEQFCQIGLNSLQYIQALTVSCVQLLDELTTLLLIMLSRDDLYTTQSLQPIYTSQRLQQLTYALLERLRLNSNTFGLPPQQCNSFCGNTIGILNKFAYCRLKLENTFGVRNQIFPKQLQIFLESFYGQLITYAQEKRYRQYNEDQHTVVQNILSTFSLLLEFGIFEELYQKIQFSLLTGVLVPLLEISPQDKDKFVQQPQNAINNYNVLLDSTKIKATEEQGTQMLVSSLINAMCKHLHGWLPNFIHNLVQSLMYNKTPLPQRLQEILLLGLVWLPMRERHGDLQLVKHYFLQQLPKITSDHHNVNQKVEATLVLMVMSRYLPLINTAQFTRQCLQCSINLLSKAIPHQPSLPIVAIDIIFTSLQSLKPTELSKADSQQLMLLLIQLTQRPDISLRILDVLLEAFEQSRVRKLIFGEMRDEFDDDDEEEKEDDWVESRMDLDQFHRIAIQAVKVMVLNIHARITDMDDEEEEDETNDALVIAKCWNIIREIVCNPDKRISIEGFVEAAAIEVNHLYKYVGDPNTTFDEDALHFSIWILKRVGHVTQGQLQIFTLVKKLFNKFGKIFDEKLFELLMLFLNKGGSLLFESQQLLNMIIDIALESLFVRLQGPKITQNNPCQGALIIQTIIILLPTVLSNQQWDNIIQQVYKRLTANQYIKFTFLKANLVSCLALGLLRSPFLSQESASAILTKLISEVGCFDTQYPLKIYAVCTCQIIKKLQGVVSQQIHALYRTLIALLIISYQKQRNKIQSRKQTAQVLEQDQQEYEVSLSFVEHELKNIDEYDYFKRTQMWLKQNKPLLYKVLVDTLTTGDKENLRRIMSIERVGSAARQIVKIGRR